MQMKSISLKTQVGLFLLLVAFLTSCAKETSTEKAKPIEPIAEETQTSSQRPLSLPVQYQNASYVLDQPEAEEAQLDEETVLKVGARITSTGGPQPLWDIVKRLVALKGMNVSWASDVDKNALVDVDINPSDDFYDALNDMLRQVDYFHEIRGNTIVIKYRDTRQYQVAMPFIKQNYSTAVGGNLLGSSGGDQVSKQVDGVIDLRSEDNTFNLWENIEANLTTILEVWNIQKERKNVIDEEAKAAYDQQSIGTSTSSGRSTGEQDSTDLASDGSVPTFRSYYTIDKPVGIITVTAPLPILSKVENYLTNLKQKLYKQISIEAKIIEVQVDDESNIGINWNNVLKNFQALTGAITFGADGQVYPRLKNNPAIGSQIYTDHTGQRTYGQDTETGLNRYHTRATGAAFYDAIDPGQFISGITLGAASFETFLNALEEEGQTKILSNPKISVMNGQPALITVGQNRTYIDRIEVEVDSDNGDKTYSIETARLLAGVGMALTATVLENEEIIMNLVPITSELVGNEIPYEIIGEEGTRVGVPVLNVREMSTTVRVGDGEMLVIGGLISDTESNYGSFAPVLGKIPGIRYLFGYETKKRKKRELIILLRPRII